MFLGQEDLSFTISNVLSLEWDQRNDRSTNRPFHALSYRVRGNANLMTANGTNTHLRTGDIAFVPSNLIYTQVAENEQLFVIHFTCNEPLPYVIKKFKPQNSEYYEHLFEKIYNAWSKKHIGYVHECKSILYKIVSKIEQEYNTQKMTAVNNSLLEAMDYIHDHFTDHSLTVEQLSVQCGMSSTYFRNQFSSAFHITPLKYINRLRLTYAEELLQSDYYTIEEIAEKCGFNNINYFSLFIKKQTGYPPSIYRAHLKNRIHNNALQ